MDDDIDEKDDTKRKSRNLSEKKRRDQFNLLINELSSIVSTTNRKMDKSTVLKSTIAFLKQHNEITVRSRVHEIQEDWKPSFLSNEEFAHLVLEALDGFIMIFSVSGKIFYASESITSLLGHLPSDLLNMTIYDLAYEEDHSEIYNLLVNPINIVMEPLQNVLTTDNQICFNCHLRRGGIDYCDDITYEFVQFIGYFRNDIDIDGLMPNTRSIGFESSDTKLLFVGTSRIQTPQLIREMSIVDATKSEFTSRHSLEWKFLFLDHRAPPIIGYLPFEVLGTSGYDYYHFDDLEKVTLCHEDLMQKGEGTSCYYRFLTKGQQWIWLQTRYYITYHQWNSKPEFVVCTHRVISYTDVIKHFRSLHIGDVTEHTMMSGESNELQFGSNLNDFLDGPENVLAQSTASSTTSNSRTTIITSTTISTSTTTPTTSKTWRLKSSNLKRFPETRSSSPNLLQPHSKSYVSTFQTPESDTMTSMSTESLASKHSVMTQYSTQCKVRQPIYLQTTSRIKQPILQEQLLHPGTLQSTDDDNQYSQNVQYLTTANSNNPQAHSDNQIVSSSTTSILPAQMLSSTTILETTPHQYITAASVQPILASNYIGTTPVLSSIHPSSELSHSTHMNTAQSHMQDQLHRKHEELQQIIVQQQEELRRVSEQLIFARYGMIPSSIPYATTTATTIPLHLNTDNPISTINNTDISHVMHQHQLPSLHSEHIAQHQHNLLHNNEIQQHQQLQQPQQIIHHQNMHHVGPQTLIQSSNRHRHHQHPLQHHHRQHQQQENSDDMLSYMELTTPIMEHHQPPRVQHQSNNEMITESNTATTTTTRLNSQHQSTQQQQQHTNDLEIMPYQMPDEQAQILFTSPRSTPK